jgi:hypothetical protein
MSDTQQAPTPAPVDPFAPPGPYWGSADSPDKLWGHERVYEGRTYGWGAVEIEAARTWRLPASCTLS